MSAISGENITVVPLNTTAGNWKHKDFPNPVFSINNTLSPFNP